MHLKAKEIAWDVKYRAADILNVVCIAVLPKHFCSASKRRQILANVQITEQ